MDDRRFDDLTRLLARGGSRRSLLKWATGVFAGAAVTVSQTRHAFGEPLGGPCTTNADCDAGHLVCIGDECRTGCFFAQNCAASGDPNCCSRCCNGCDENNICICVDAGGACTEDSDCCGGDLCEQNFCGGPVQCAPNEGDDCSQIQCCGNMICSDSNTCELPTGACAEVPEDCDVDADCCLGLLCDNGTSCCFPVQSACPLGTDCCGAATCTGGFCCMSTGESCGVDGDCCEGSCIQGFCGPSVACAPFEGNCAEAICCPSQDPGIVSFCNAEDICDFCLVTGIAAVCVSVGVADLLCCDPLATFDPIGCICAIPCVGKGEKCGDDHDCCGHLQCVKGFCGTHDICVVEKGVCNEKHPCCKGFACIYGFCKPHKPHEKKPDVSKQPAAAAPAAGVTVGTLPSTGVGVAGAGQKWLGAAMVGGAAAAVASWLKRDSEKTADEA